MRASSGVNVMAAWGRDRARRPLTHYDADDAPESTAARRRSRTPRIRWRRGDVDGPGVSRYRRHGRPAPAALGASTAMIREGARVTPRRGGIVGARDAAPEPGHAIRRSHHHRGARAPDGQS